MSINGGEILFFLFLFLSLSLSAVNRIFSWQNVMKVKHKVRNLVLECGNEWYVLVCDARPKVLEIHCLFYQINEIQLPSHITCAIPGSTCSMAATYTLDKSDVYCLLFLSRASPSRSTCSRNLQFSSRKKKPFAQCLMNTIFVKRLQNSSLLSTLLI